MDTLQRLFAFLESNRAYNREVQQNYYRHTLLQHTMLTQRLYCLLHSVVHTQSRPKMDAIGPFFKHYFACHSSIETFADFVRFLEQGIPPSKAKIDPNTQPYLYLYDVVNKQSGWGPKTAALLVKALYHLHSDQYAPELAIFAAFPELQTDDRLFLPVDLVISHVFKEDLKVDFPANFNGINAFLQQHYNAKQMEVWDDLWFWGYITQSTKNSSRCSSGFNENKYWSNVYTNKQLDLTLLKLKIDEYLEIINAPSAQAITSGL